jgi:hypothetical protein
MAKSVFPTKPEIFFLQSQCNTCNPVIDEKEEGGEDYSEQTVRCGASVKIPGSSLGDTILCAW